MFITLTYLLMFKLQNFTIDLFPELFVPLIEFSIIVSILTLLILICMQHAVLIDISCIIRDFNSLSVLQYTYILVTHITFLISTLIICIAVFHSLFQGVLLFLSTLSAIVPFILHMLDIKSYLLFFLCHHLQGIYISLCIFYFIHY